MGDTTPGGYDRRDAYRVIPDHARWLCTPATSLLGITYPLVSAPMGDVSGGALAAAVSDAGGLGMLGVGYADAAWLAKEFTTAAGRRVGCGFITWRLAREPALLDLALERGAAAIMLSYGDVGPLAARVRDAGIPLLCQVSTVGEAARALDDGADVLVAQGSEAGGHGTHRRSTLTLVPEVCDLVSQRRTGTPVLAAGGVADGRGLAAALMLGAAGALLGTRFLATSEALVCPRAQERIARATGDDTLTTTVYDQVRGVPWPTGYSSRVLASSFTTAWHGTDENLLLDQGLCEATRQYRSGADHEDLDVAAVTAGEAVGLVSRPEPAATVVDVVVAEALAALEAYSPP